MSSASITPLDIRLNIPGSTVRGDDPQIAGWLFWPPALDVAKPVTLAFCLHGGSYDRRYYHLEIPGHPGYSMAQHLAGQGIVAVAIDWLAIGESSRVPDPMALGMECRVRPS